MTILLFSLNAFATYPYVTVDQDYTDNGSVYEVTPMSPIKAQDDIGLCYGFSATTLLENYRCHELNLDCSDPNDFLSTFDVTSHREVRSLVEGGNPTRILSNIERSNGKIAKEECVKFSTLVYQMANSQNQITTNEKKGWSFLIRKWNEYKGIDDSGKTTKSNDCTSCLADTIKATLVNIKTPAEQIRNAFTDAKSVDEFLYKAILPAECLQDDKMANIPKFVTRTYPSGKENFSEEGMSKKIESLLISNIPVQISLCALPGNPCPIDSGHATTLVGIKEVCKNNDCKKVVKVHNSYGESWQRHNNDGWVDLNTLIESAHIFGENNSLTWIEKPGLKLTEKRLSTKTYTQIEPPSYTPVNNSTKPAKYKDYHGTWKCPGAKYTQEYESGCVPMR